MTTPHTPAGADIRACRIRAGLTSADLAQQAKVDPKTLRDFELGRRTPRAPTVRRITEALKPALDELDTPEVHAEVRRTERLTEFVAQYARAKAEMVHVGLLYAGARDVTLDEAFHELDAAMNAAFRVRPDSSNQPSSLTSEET